MEIQDKIVVKKELIESYANGIVPADEGNNYVEIPFISSGPGFVAAARSRIESVGAQPQSLLASVKQLSLEEFKEYHRRISADMAFIKYNGDINMSDIEFYSYDRFLVFGQIWKRARADGIIPDIEDVTFGKDVNDIVFIWLVRGTNLERIKVGLSEETQKRISTLIRRYAFAKRTIDPLTGTLNRLQNNELTVSRFCDIYPMKVWAMWVHPKVSERPDFMTFSDLSKEEKEKIRLFRCPSLPYLCSKTRADGSKDVSDFNGILLVHTIVLTDFDRLMFEWVKHKDNMPNEFTPRVDLIKKIIRKKSTARVLVPEDKAKYETLSKTNLIVGTSHLDMKENLAALNEIKGILKKMLGAVLHGEVRAQISLNDLLRSLNDKDKLPEIQF